MCSRAIKISATIRSTSIKHVHLHYTNTTIQTNKINWFLFSIIIAFYGSSLTAHKTAFLCVVIMGLRESNTRMCARPECRRMVDLMLMNSWIVFVLESHFLSSSLVYDPINMIDILLLGSVVGIVVALKLVLCATANFRIIKTNQFWLALLLVSGRERKKASSVHNKSASN